MSIQYNSSRGSSSRTLYVAVYAAVLLLAAASKQSTTPAQKYGVRTEPEHLVFHLPPLRRLVLTPTTHRSPLPSFRCSAYDRRVAHPCLQRTKLCKKTLNPYWGEEFKFEVADDSALQNEPIEFKVWCGCGRRLFGSRPCYVCRDLVTLWR